MVRNASLFSQVLQHISRTEFVALVKEHRAERGSKGFTCWTQCVAMLFCHLARADSLREICNGLACCLGKLNHLGIETAPKKSTLAHANQHRPAELYESLFWSLLARFRSSKLLGSEHQRPFKFKNRLQSLDSTTISLCLELFPWAEYRQTKGGVKVHILLDHSDYMASYAVITEGKRANVRIAQSLQLKPGSIVAMDRAYNDFELFGRWSRDAVFFVTPMKKGTVYEVVEQRDLPQNRPILADEIIRFTSRKAKKDCPELLRRVMENRALLQCPKTEPEDQDLHRHQRKRAAHPDLDSLDRHAAASLASSPVQGSLVILLARVDAQAQPLYLPELEGVA